MYCSLFHVYPFHDAALRFSCTKLLIFPNRNQHHLLFSLFAVAEGEAVTFGDVIRQIVYFLFVIFL